MKCCCSRTCTAQARKGKRYAGYHRSKTIRRRIAKTLHKRWKNLSPKAKQLEMKPLLDATKATWAGYTPGQKRKRIEAAKVGVLKWVKKNRESILKANNKKSRRRKISRSLRKQWADGTRKPRLNISIKTRRKLSRSLRKAYSEGRRSPAKMSFNRKYKIGWFQSIKCAKRFFYRSSWELRLMQHLEKSSKVTSWDTEGCIKVPYRFNGKRCTYFPDFLIDFRIRGKLRLLAVELKPADSLGAPRFKTRKKITIARTLCEEIGLKYILVTNIDKFCRQYL